MNTQITIIVLTIGAISVAGTLVGCSQRGAGEFEKGGSVPERTIEQVQEDHTDEWMAIPGVEGTGIGLCDDKPCIKIFSSIKPEQLRAKIPSNVEGYAVIIEETGAFRALDE
ncbi:MAG: hypothetical protein CEE38_12635 [Planctomycetes bacterium B3_Pla]|nr:MAG: hypothetical protein CEE38_12635 [Planctomycetes bacterium B3_Pla]